MAMENMDTLNASTADDTYVQQVESSLAEYDALINTDEERQLFNRLTSQWDQYMIGIDSAALLLFWGL